MSYETGGNEQTVKRENVYGQVRGCSVNDRKVALVQKYDARPECALAALRPTITNV